MLTPNEQTELRDLRRRDELLMQLIREQVNPQKREAVRKEQRQIVDRIEVLEAKEAAR